MVVMRRRIAFYTLAGIELILCCLAYSYYQRTAVEGMRALILAVVILILSATVYVEVNRWTLRSRRFCVVFLAGLMLVNLVATVLLWDRKIPKENFLEPEEERTLIPQLLNMSHGATMTSTGLQFLSRYMFSGKQVIVAENAYNNPGVSLILLETNATSVSIESLAREEFETLHLIYKAQTINMTLTDDSVYTIYLLTGEEWLEEEILYALGCEGDTVIAPKSMIDGFCLIQESNTDENRSSYPSISRSELIFHKDAVTEECFTNDKGAALSNFVFLLYLFVVGFVLLFPFGGVIGTAATCALAMIAGTGVYVATCLVVGFTGLAFNIWIAGTAPLLLACAGYALGMWKSQGQSHWRPSQSALPTLIVIIAVLSFTSLEPHTHLTTDSYLSVLLGHRIAEGGFLSNLSRISSYSFLGTLINTGTSLLGVQYAYAFVPAFVACGLLSIFLLQGKLFSLYCGRSAAWCISLATTLVYVFTPMFLINSVWIMNNLPLGIILASAVLFLLLHYKTGETVYAWMFPFPFLLFCLIRIEGPLFGVAALVCFRPLWRSEKLFKTVVHIFTLMHGALYLAMYTNLRDNYDPVFWSPTKGGALVGMTCLLCLYLWLERYLKKNTFARVVTSRLDETMLILLTLMILSALIFLREKSLENLSALMETTFFIGYYNVFWLVLPAIGLLTAWIPETEWIPPQSLGGFIIAFFLALFILMLAREVPLHTSYGDSGCRMLLHILPTAGIHGGLIAAVICDRKGAKI